MLIPISKICSRGGKVNEDAVYISQDLMIVVDGATPLNGTNKTNAESDAQWLARKTIELLPKELERTNTPLGDGLMNVAIELKRLLTAFGYESGSYPTAGIGVVLLRGNTLYTATLGDIAIILRGDRVDALIYDKTLEGLDRAVINRMQELHKSHGCTMKQARDLVQEDLITNRAKANVEGGYKIFDASGIGVRNIIVGEVPASSVKHIIIMSDGYHVLRRYKNMDFLDRRYTDLLVNGKGDDLLKWIRSVENADLSCERYPRFKPMDDASLLVAKLDKER